jgi:N-acetylglutamate synthase-like GNAT family acetyltransferase
MPKDIMPDFLFKEKVFDDTDYRPELNLMAVDEHEDVPAGIVSAVIRTSGENKTGFIKLLCVPDQYRRQGIASSLYSEVENKFIAEGIKEIRVCESVPNYFMPGIDPFYTEAVCFFENKGFVKFNDTSNLIADLLNNNFNTVKEEQKLLSEGIVIKRAEDKDRSSLMELIEKYFNGWKGEIESSYKNIPVAIYIAVMSGNVIGFSAYEGNNKGTGWFGPMGTNPDYRGKGAGSVLFKKCLQELKDLGFAKAVIPWVGPIPFYMKHANAKVNRVFWRYKKVLN